MCFVRQHGMLIFFKKKNYIVQYNKRTGLEVVPHTILDNSYPFKAIKIVSNKLRQLFTVDV